VPIYIYKCDDCLEEFKVSHGMSENWENCNICESVNIARKPLSFTNLSKVTNKPSKKVGELTKEFIEDAKKDLKEQLQELNKKR
jgi:hypothetical protein